jgi:hypothetical protein
MKQNKNEVVFDYAAYKALCEKMGLTPCDPGGFMMGMGYAEPDEIPYITPRDTIWLRNVKKKRNNDRPLAPAIFGLLDA